MKKITLAAAISTIAASPAFAASYTKVFYSGTSTDPSASFSTVSAQPTQITDTSYVNPLSGTASNPAAPKISMAVASNWTFDFTVPSAVAFTGTLEMGDFKTQMNMTLPFTTPYVTSGRQTYTGVKYLFSGVGTYDEATNTFTYSYQNSTVNGGGGATYTETAPATCQNGATHLVNKVCTVFAQTSKNWEGLALNFVFTEDRSQFGGSLTGTQSFGSGLTRSTTTINWQTAVPVPAGAWLFGSGLIGLASARYRRRSA